MVRIALTLTKRLGKKQKELWFVSETRLYVPDTYVIAAAGTSCLSPRLFFTLIKPSVRTAGGRIGSDP